MPNIQIKTNVTASEEKQNSIKNELGNLIELIDGKSEKWLMVNLSFDEKMWFQGTQEPCAYVQLDAYGKIDEKSSKEFTKAITELIYNLLKVEKNRIYVSYFYTNYWGWNGDNF